MNEMTLPDEIERPYIINVGLPRVESIDLEYGPIEQEYDDMGSYNHSLVQANIAYFLKKYSAHSAFIELSLDASSLDKATFPNVKDELIPDVCTYPRRSVVDMDILLMNEMPILVVEVVSPRQGVLSIVQKIQAYFALGVQSCWLVEPITAVVRVYHANLPPRTFSAGDLIDTIVDIKAPVTEIFE